VRRDADLISGICYAVLWCSGMHDLHDSWFLEYKGKSGTPYLGQTLRHSPFLLLTLRRFTRAPDSQRQLHGPSGRTGRTRPPDRKDNGGAAVLAENIRRRRRLVSEMRWRYVSLEFMISSFVQTLLVCRSYLTVTK